MGNFICAKCGVIENTATGHWWTRKRIEMYDWPKELEKFKGHGLCSECGPTHFSDGTKTDFGKWHDKFEKTYFKDLKSSELELRTNLYNYAEYIKFKKQEESSTENNVET